MNFSLSELSSFSFCPMIMCCTVGTLVSAQLTWSLTCAAQRGSFLAIASVLVSVYLYLYLNLYLNLCCTVGMPVNAQLNWSLICATQRGNLDQQCPTAFKRDFSISLPLKSNAIIISIRILCKGYIITSQ